MTSYSHVVTVSLLPGLSGGRNAGEGAGMQHANSVARVALGRGMLRAVSEVLSLGEWRLS